MYFFSWHCFFRNAGINDPDSKGDMPIHYAARAGRSKNIDVLMKHAKSIGKFFLHLLL